MNNRDKKYLKSYIGTVLREDYEGSDSSDYQGSGGGGGGGGAKKGDVAGAFKNLWNTIVGSVKVIASKTKTLLKLTKELVVTTLLKPWEKAEYEKIMSEGEMEYQLIKKKYPDQKLWENVHEDIKTALFFLYPAAFVSGYALKYGKDAVKGTYKALTDPAGIGDKKKDAKDQGRNPRYQYENDSGRSRYETSSEERTVTSSSRRRSQKEGLIATKFGSPLLVEKKDSEKQDKKPSKEKVAALSKDLNKVIKKVAKQRIPLLEKLVQEMKESGESEKKAISNLEKQIKILRSL